MLGTVWELTLRGKHKEKSSSSSDLLSAAKKRIYASIKMLPRRFPEAYPATGAEAGFQGKSKEQYRKNRFTEARYELEHSRR